MPRIYELMPMFNLLMPRFRPLMPRFCPQGVALYPNRRTLPPKKIYFDTMYVQNGSFSFSPEIVDI